MTNKKKIFINISSVELKIFRMTVNLLTVFCISVFFKQICVSEEKIVYENEMSLNILRNNTNHLIGILNFKSELNKNFISFVRFDECKIPFYKKLCGKFGYDDEISEAFACSNQLNGLFDNYLELVPNFQNFYCCQL